ncbi:hypothetical protein BFJ63_vAg16997 [Fusarium oxysporum f. sp. narcissi]|uniref:Uncharacterized protein n=1 Tax=Fusarium oxysporum f. sp. narcissi TaxID=451672 RepID=A0A4Q2UZZ0_FUSOX|nr:hypothetical protein BFJ63_vAg16997 [Fusarium oxysporum f. sp. narcissi]
MATSATTARNGLHQNHASFLERFNARQAQNRVAKQKPTLSVDEHAAHRAQLGKARFNKPRYSEQTEINVSGIFNKWRRVEGDAREPRPRNDTGLPPLHLQALQDQIMGQRARANDTASTLLAAISSGAIQARGRPELVDGERQEPKDGSIQEPKPRSKSRISYHGPFSGPCADDSSCGATIIVPSGAKAVAQAQASEEG